MKWNEISGQMNEMEKICLQEKNKEQTDRRFKDWDHSILCGYSRELANNIFLAPSGA